MKSGIGRALFVGMTVFAATPTSAAERPRGVSIYAYRTPEGRRRMIAGGGGTTKEAEAAVDAGLLWLAKAQERDGRWSCKRWGGKGNYDMGVTGLALLAYLGAGYAQRSGPFKETVGRGLDWLAANQKPDGSFAFRTFYEQGIATMAVCEAYGLTRSPKVGRMAQKAASFLVRTQPEHGGFRYMGAVPRDQGDLSATSWQIMAMNQAIFAGLNVPKQAIERSRVFLRNTYAGEGKSKYVVVGGAGSPSMWAAGMCCRQFIDRFTPEVGDAAKALMADAKDAERRRAGQNLYFTYYSTLAMHQMGGEYWVRWNARFRDTLVKAQARKREDDEGRFIRGSWDPSKDRFARGAGRVYATAMAVLCLEVYYRYARFGKTVKPAGGSRLPEGGSF